MYGDDGEFFCSRNKCWGVPQGPMRNPRPVCRFCGGPMVFLVGRGKPKRDQMSRHFDGRDIDWVWTFVVIGIIAMFGLILWGGLR